MNDLHRTLSSFLDHYLRVEPSDGRPLVVLTWAQSLDAKIAPITRTPIALSGLETKFMTHLIRRRVDAILIGAETAVTDNPSLNGIPDSTVTDCSSNTGKRIRGRMDGCADGGTTAAGYTRS
jgi:hypothetical protein